MQSITREYLLDIIHRKISTTIHLHRKRHPYSINALQTRATMQEVQDFVASIPYFDAGLKAFLNSDTEAQTIISQAWELEFIKKCECWMQGYEWLHGKPFVSAGMTPAGIPGGKQHLTLPY